MELNGTSFACIWQGSSPQGQPYCSRAGSTCPFVDFGHVRNRVHHRLYPDMVPERAMQILGFIDYLLFLICASERRKNDYPHSV